METGDGNIANDFEALQQECLDSSTVHFKYLLEKEYRTYVNFTWEVQRYSNLQSNVIYCKAIKSWKCKWLFQLVKTKEILFLFLSSEEIPNISATFYLVSSDPDAQSQSKDCAKISEGLYVSDFCSHVIQDPNNKLLVKDVLRIHCRYRTRPVEHYHTTVPYGQLSIKSDSHDLCEDFRTLYLNMKLRPDFVLLSGNDKAIFLHKLVLRARSQFFKDIFDEDDAMNFKRKEFIINAHSSIVECIVMYMYCGELKDMPHDNCIGVFSNAAMLKIPSLVNRCVEILKERLSEDNVYDILTIAVMFNVMDMKNECIRFFAGLKGRKLTDIYDYIRSIEI